MFLVVFILYNINVIYFKFIVSKFKVTNTDIRWTSDKKKQNYIEYIGKKEDNEVHVYSRGVIIFFTRTQVGPGEVLVFMVLHVTITNGISS